MWSLSLIGWLLNKKAARVEVIMSLAFLHWVGIAFHPWPFVSDIAIFVLKGDVKLQLTNCWKGICDLSPQVLFWFECKMKMYQLTQVGVENVGYNRGERHVCACSQKLDNSFTINTVRRHLYTSVVRYVASLPSCPCRHVMLMEERYWLFGWVCMLRISLAVVHWKHVVMMYSIKFMLWWKATISISALML